MKWNRTLSTLALSVCFTLGGVITASAEEEEVQALVVDHEYEGAARDYRAPALIPMLKKLGYKTSEDLASANPSTLTRQLTRLPIEPLVGETGKTTKKVRRRAGTTLGKHSRSAPRELAVHLIKGAKAQKKTIKLDE